MFGILCRRKRKRERRGLDCEANVQIVTSFKITCESQERHCFMMSLSWHPVTWSQILVCCKQDWKNFVETYGCTYQLMAVELTQFYLTVSLWLLLVTWQLTYSGNAKWLKSLIKLQSSSSSFMANVKGPWGGNVILVPQWVPLIIAREWLLFLLDCNGRNCVPCMAVCKSLLQHEVISRILDFFLASIQAMFSWDWTVAVLN